MALLSFLRVEHNRLVLVILAKASDGGLDERKAAHRGHARLCKNPLGCSVIVSDIV